MDVSGATTRHLPPAAAAQARLDRHVPLPARAERGRKALDRRVERRVRHRAVPVWCTSTAFEHPVSVARKRHPRGRRKGHGQKRARFHLPHNSFVLLTLVSRRVVGPTPPSARSCLHTSATTVATSSAGLAGRGCLPPVRCRPTVSRPRIRPTPRRRWPAPRFASTLGLVV